MNDLGQETTEGIEMDTEGTRVGSIGWQWIIMLIVVCLVLPSFSYTSATGGDISGVGASEFISSGGYLGTNDSAVQWGPEVCLTNSTSNSTQPSIAVDNSGRLHLVWIDDRNKSRSKDGDIFYMNSMNGGTEWSDYEILFPITRMGTYNNIKLICDSKSLYLVFVDHDVRREEPTLHYLASQDYGKNWEAPYPYYLHPPSDYDDCRIDIASNSNYVYIVMNDYWYLDDRIYVLNETNIVGSKIWEGISCPSIGAWNSNVYAVIPTNDGLNFSMSNDNGTTWSLPIKLSSKKTYTSTLFTYGNSLYLVWANNSSGNYELYFKKSDDGGTAWSKDIRLTYATGASIRPSVSMNSDGSLNVVWQDYRENKWEVYYKNIDNDGKTLMNSTRLSNSTGDAKYPQIITDSNGYSYVVWQDSRNGNWDIYMRRNPDKDVTPPEITHQPVEEISGTQNLTINATVTDNFGVQYVSVRYWGDRTTTPLTKKMVLTSGDIKNGAWEAKILPSELHSRNIYYYIQAADSDNIAVTSIYHVVVTGCSPHFDAIGNYSVAMAGDREINISITDTFGVDNVVLYYSVNGSEYTALNMTLSAGDSVTGVWSTTIQGLPAGSNVSFYVEAVSGDTTNSTEVFSFATEKNEVTSDLTPPSDDSNTSMVGNPAESGGLAGVFYSNLLPIVAGIMALVILVGAVIFRRASKKDKGERK